MSDDDESESFIISHLPLVVLIIIMILARQAVTA